LNILCKVRSFCSCARVNNVIRYKNKIRCYTETWRCGVTEIYAQAVWDVEEILTNRGCSLGGYGLKALECRRRFFKKLTG